MNSDGRLLSRTFGVRLDWHYCAETEKCVALAKKAGIRAE